MQSKKAKSPAALLAKARRSVDAPEFKSIVASARKSVRAADVKRWAALESGEGLEKAQIDYRQAVNEYNSLIFMVMSDQKMIIKKVQA